ncbi:hypothetical protein L596_025218 [Steinernema carpocapsae]|uniref:NADH dehydrogenase [ubiquinone] 1 alpha subcomplex subunit 2 n=1 Tax=Steinernema carpocapsae TaxID=34508 RepID=A0A4U5M756_STECR|nr:hypothetical protein L596_025218 [Steinernema carpocapsae]
MTARTIAPSPKPQNDSSVRTQVFSSSIISCIAFIPVFPHANQHAQFQMSSALKLGAGALRELRIHLCQKSSASAGIRAFIENDYVPLKKNNLKFPILIRECSGISPKVWARYEYGVETAVSLENASQQQVAEAIKQLATLQPPPRA